ncbi:MAG: cytochrome C [Deltaproteobacteria bacterium]|nr:cytochrome C [Deltaproteobacteria bacterium]
MFQAPARASWVESLVMPGEVVAKHAKVEHECTKCHAPLDKVAQERLCLTCHKDVDEDRRDKRGFHGQSPDVGDRPCKTCHAEHKGRSADLIRLDRDKFDHRLTDRPLVGAHLKARCDGCHKDGKRFREAPSRCSDCHAAKDPHEGVLGLACDHCHEESLWKTVRFNHDTAAFQLTGRHREARCEGCHKTRRFKPTATDCFSCHEGKDEHRGSFGRECQSCHTTRGFAAAVFDHARKTKFPLAGKHSQVACEKCHKKGLAAANTPTACRDCHERDEPHRGQFGIKCESCHTPADWRRSTFDHDRHTRFPLRGRHAGRRCADCHRGDAQSARLDQKCVSCHRRDDVHHGRQGTDCKRCHDERGWSRDVLIDHNATRFALTGAHARTACLACHRSPSFKDVALECAGCHQPDALAHKCQRGDDCARCHDTTSFRTIRAAH